jgi:hypothetical protein
MSSSSNNKVKNLITLGRLVCKVVNELIYLGPKPAPLNIPLIEIVNIVNKFYFVIKFF